MALLNYFFYYREGPQAIKGRKKAHSVWEILDRSYGDNRHYTKTFLRGEAIETLS